MFVTPPGEIDDRCWGEYGGIKEVTLNRERLIVHFDPSRANPHNWSLD